MEKFFGALLFVAGVSLFGLVGYATIKSISSNGEVDYCYVEMWSPDRMAPQFQLFGHRPWRQDRMIGVYPTIDEAKSRADLLGCRVGTK